MALRKKRKCKTRLAKAKAAADKWCFLFFRGLPCVVCGTNYATAGHHIIPKSRSLRHRHSTENIIPLCPKHHTMGTDICAHSQSSLAVGRFLDWLLANRHDQYRWAEDHERDKCTFKAADFEDIAQYWQDVVNEQRDYARLMQIAGLDPKEATPWPRNE